jgi:hypothetical protein
MKLPLAPLALTAVCLCLAPLSAQKPQSRNLFAEIQAPPDWSPAGGDFELTEGGTRRTITQVVPANAAMRVALLVDTSAETSSVVNQIRTSLLTFVDALPPPHELALVVMGRQARVLQKGTADREAMKKTVNALFSDGGGVVFGNALQETVRQVIQPSVGWPVIVALTTPGNDASNLRLPDEFNRLTNDLLLRGATVHALVLQRSTQMGTLRDFATALTKDTRGVLETVAPAALGDGMKSVAERILADQQEMNGRYRFEYQSDGKTGHLVLQSLKPDVQIGRMSLTRLF